MNEQERIAEKKRELDALRPVSGRSLAALAKWYDVELTYTSNAIEGNTLTRNETAILLENGLTVSGKPLRDHLEAIGHRGRAGLCARACQGGDPIRGRYKTSIALCYRRSSRTRRGAIATTSG